MSYLKPWSKAPLLELGFTLLVYPIESIIIVDVQVSFQVGMPGGRIDVMGIPRVGQYRVQSL